MLMSFLRADKVISITKQKTESVSVRVLKNRVGRGLHRSLPFKGEKNHGTEKPEAESDVTEYWLAMDSVGRANGGHFNALASIQKYAILYVKTCLFCFSCQYHDNYYWRKYGAHASPLKSSIKRNVFYNWQNHICFLLQPVDFKQRNPPSRSPTW